MMSKVVLLTALLLGAHYAQAETVRDPAQVRAFKRAHPCPSTGKSRGACPGHVVDHVVPLVCGGSDRPSNMQWQTTEAAKAKDKWEAKGCKKGGRHDKP